MQGKSEEYQKTMTKAETPTEIKELWLEAQQERRQSASLPQARRDEVEEELKKLQ